MAIADTDLSVASNGNIRWTGGATPNYPVLDLHRWLMGKLSNATSAGDDLLNVTNAFIPSTRKTDNVIVLNAPYNIDDATARHFYNGSIEQDGGNTLYSGLQVVGKVNRAATNLQVVQNNALLTNWWATGVNVDATNNILLQMLVKTKTAGAFIDGGRLRVQAREMDSTGGDEFAYFNVTLGQGVGVAAVFANNDDFNSTAVATVAAFTGIATTVEGFQAFDVDQNGSNEYYISKWTVGANGNPRKDVYERAKWLTRRGSASTIFGMNGELFIGITHSIPFGSATGGTGTTYNQNEVLSWGTGATAGTGALLGCGNAAGTADGKNAASGTFYIQLLTGLAPSSGVTITGVTSGRTSTATTPFSTAQNVNAKCFLGSYTGSLSSAFGQGIDPAGLVATDALRNLAGTSINPPNNVQLVVSGVVSGDTVFAAETKTHTNTISGTPAAGATSITLGTTYPAGYDTVGRVMINGVEHVYTAWSGTTMTLGGAGLNATQANGNPVTVTQFWTDDFTTAATGNTSGLGTLTVQTTIGLAYPTTGKVRVWNSTTSVFDVYTYTSYTGSVFTLSGTLAATYQSQKCFVPFIDEVAGGTSISKTIVYPGSAIAGRMRLYNSTANIVPLELPFSIGSTGAAISAIRNSDA